MMSQKGCVDIDMIIIFKNLNLELVLSVVVMLMNGRGDPRKQLNYYLMTLEVMLKNLLTAIVVSVLGKPLNQEKFQKTTMSVILKSHVLTGSTIKQKKLKKLLLQMWQAESKIVIFQLGRLHWKKEQLISFSQMLCTWVVYIEHCKSLILSLIHI